MKVINFLFVSFLSIALCDKLSPAEDEERSKTCGILPIPQSTSNEELSPWTVIIAHKYWNTATLISKRHVLTAASTLIQDTNKKFTWRHDDSVVDMSKCVDGVMEIPTSLFTIMLDSCNDHFICPWRKPIAAKSAHFVGICGTDFDLFGFLLIEMETEIPEDSDYWTPVCLSEAINPTKVGEALNSYAYYLNNGKRNIEKISGKVSVCNNWNMEEYKICYNPSKCLSTLTTSLIKTIEKRRTLIGFSMYSYNKCTLEVHGSVGFYKQKICDLAGICKPTSTEFYSAVPKPLPTISMTNDFKKLSSDENKQRSDTCGKLSNPGSSAAIDLAPWAIITYRENEKSELYYGSSVLISKRHFLVPAFNIIGDPFTWKTDSTPVDISKCKNNMMEIPTEHLKRIYADMSQCGDSSKCGSKIHRQVKSGIYFGNCETGVTAFGVILFEMDSDLPADYPYFTPICIPEKKKPQLESNAQFFSIVYDDDKFVWSTIPAETVECHDKYNHYSLICVKPSECQIGRRGGISKNIDGRETLLGTIYYDDPKCKEDTFVSVEVLSDLLCSFAGICGDQGFSQVTQNYNDAKTDSPTDSPTVSSTDLPTDASTDARANSPTDIPTGAPTDFPIDLPTEPSTDTPIDSPTDALTEFPTDASTFSADPEKSTEKAMKPTNAPSSTIGSIPSTVLTTNANEIKTSAASNTHEDSDDQSEKDDDDDSEEEDNDRNNSRTDDNSEKDSERESEDDRNVDEEKKARRIGDSQKESNVEAGNSDALVDEQQSEKASEPDSSKTTLTVTGILISITLYNFRQY